MEVLAVATGAGHHVAQLAAEGDAALFQVNLFWVIVSALNFILFFILIWSFAFKPVSAMLASASPRSSRASRTPNRPGAIGRTRSRSASPRSTEARREANEILARAQKVAQETRDADIAATREELERLRVRAAAEIEAEKTRAIAGGPRRGRRPGPARGRARSSARR